MTDILTKIDDYLTEKKDMRDFALKSVISNFGLPKNRTDVVKFWQSPGRDKWVVIVRHKSKYYGIDNYDEMWEGDLDRMINNIRKSTGAKFAGSKIDLFKNDKS